MRTLRVKTSVTLDPDLLSYVKRTGRRMGVSERINQLLKQGIDVEKAVKASDAWRKLQGR
jgi:uncharacterized protein (DUF4415 family)